MFLCSCKAITESQVQCLAATGASPSTIVSALGLDDPECCGRCLRNLDRIALICGQECPQPGDRRQAPVALAR